VKIGFSDQKEPDRIPDKTDDYEGEDAIMCLDIIRYIELYLISI
jgi:hypothetical protein